MPPFNPLQYQNEMQDKFERVALWNVNQANKADFELCNNLMLLDTVALTVTAFILTSSNALNTVGRAGAILLIISSILVVLSIFSGIGNYIMLNRFQKRWGRARGRTAFRFSLGPLTPDQMNIIQTQEQSNLPDNSNLVFWYIQIATLALAVVLYLTIIIDVLSKKI